MHLLVGLGNPGSQFAGNRHNAGFLVVDEIHERHRFGSYHERFGGWCSMGVIEDERILLLKPTTFMNESGRSVDEVARFYKVPTEKILVLHDEIDLESGKIRIKVGGSSAGHNGVKSIAQCLDQNFQRLRIGVGHPGNKELVTGHVLGDFSKEEYVWLEKVIDAIADNISLLLKGDDQEFLREVEAANKNS